MTTKITLSRRDNPELWSAALSNRIFHVIVTYPEKATISQITEYLTRNSTQFVDATEKQVERSIETAEKDVEGSINLMLANSLLHSPKLVVHPKYPHRRERLFRPTETALMWISFLDKKYEIVFEK